MNHQLVIDLNNYSYYYYILNVSRIKTNLGTKSITYKIKVPLPNFLRNPYSEKPVCKDYIGNIYINDIY